MFLGEHIFFSKYGSDYGRMEPFLEEMDQNLEEWTRFRKIKPVLWRNESDFESNQKDLEYQITFYRMGPFLKEPICFWKNGSDFAEYKKYSNV